MPYIHSAAGGRVRGGVVNMNEKGITSSGVSTGGRWGVSILLCDNGVRWQ